jgi:hypothetical protein
MSTRLHIDYDSRSWFSSLAGILAVYEFWKPGTVDVWIANQTALKGHFVQIQNFDF